MRQSIGVKSGIGLEYQSNVGLDQHNTVTEIVSGNEGVKGAVKVRRGIAAWENINELATADATRHGPRRQIGARRAGTAG